jgi:hypothetical protein
MLEHLSMDEFKTVIRNMLVSNLHRILFLTPFQHLPNQPDTRLRKAGEPYISLPVRVYILAAHQNVIQGKKDVS